MRRQERLRAPVRLGRVGQRVHAIAHHPTEAPIVPGPQWDWCHSCAVAIIERSLFILVVEMGGGIVDESLAADLGLLRAQPGQDVAALATSRASPAQVFNALLSSPAHQYSLITISDQPRRPGRVNVEISMTRPCLGPITLCRSRSNSTPACVQCECSSRGLVMLTNRSNSLKNDRQAKFFTARAPSQSRGAASDSKS